jgi:hypothetical protein
MVSMDDPSVTKINHRSNLMKSLIQQLVETPGPSGFEYAIRDVIREAIGDTADDIRVDALGRSSPVILQISALETVCPFPGYRWAQQFTILSCSLVKAHRWFVLQALQRSYWPKKAAIHRSASHRVRSGWYCKIAGLLLAR